MRRRRLSIYYIGTSRKYIRKYIFLCVYRFAVKINFVMEISKNNAQKRFQVLQYRVLLVIIMCVGRACQTHAIVYLGIV